MKDQEGRDLACSRQLVCMFMLHFLANMVIRRMIRYLDTSTTRFVNVSPTLRPA